MKLLVYSRFFAPHVGGAETYAMLLATGLSRQSGPETDEAVRVTLVTQTLANGFSDPSLPFRVIRRPSLPRLFMLLRRADVVHLVGPCLIPMLIAWILRKPFIVEQHGYQSICPNGLLFIDSTKSVCPGNFMAGRHAKCLKCNSHEGMVRSLKMWLLTFVRRWLCGRARANIAITDHVQRRLDLPNTLTIYYGIPDLTNAGVADAPCFAYLGRLVKEKGAEVLLDAAARLKADGLQFNLRVIGDGPERENLQRFAADRNLDSQVIFAGFLTGESLRDAMADVSVIVMPSLCEETAGFSAIEQMMRGRLVICSDIGGLGEMVGGAGLKFAAGDAAALAELMRKVMQKPEIVKELGQRARERALRLFTLDRMIKEHVTLYRSIIPARLSGIEAAAEIR